MRDGKYALRLSADGYVGDGQFTMRDNRGQGHDGRFKVEGHLIERPATLDAIFNVLMEPDALGNSEMPDHYSLQMTGATRDDHFNVIGVGPLGLIIEITGEWAGSSDEQPDARLMRPAPAATIRRSGK